MLLPRKRSGPPVSSAFDQHQCRQREPPMIDTRTPLVVQRRRAPRVQTHVIVVHTKIKKRSGSRRSQTPSPSNSSTPKLGAVGATSDAPPPLERIVAHDTKPPSLKRPAQDLLVSSQTKVICCVLLFFVCITVGCGLFPFILCRTCSSVAKRLLTTALPYDSQRLHVFFRCVHSA